MMLLHSALTLARKDLRLFFRDRTAVLLTFLLPIVLGSVFGAAMGSMSGGERSAAPRIGLALEDRDDSAESRALIAALQRADGLRIDIVADARGPVANGKRAVGLAIPEGYGAGLRGGTPPELSLFRDTSQTISQQVVLFQLAPALAERQLAALGAGVMGRILDVLQFPAAGRSRAEAVLRQSYTDVETIVAGLSDREPAVGGSTEAASAQFEPLRDLPRFLGIRSEDVAGLRSTGASPKAGASHAFSAMAVMMLLFSVAGAGGALLQERTDGTLTRLQLTPAAGRAVLLGKALSLGLVAVLQLKVMFAFGWLVFDVPIFERPVALAAVSGAWAALAVGLGLAFAVHCRNAKQLEGLSTLVILVMSAVGGAWFPREVTPEWFRTVGSVTPVAWAMDAYHGILWYGKGLLPRAELDGVGVSVLGMAAAALLLAGVSLRGYRRHFLS